MSIYKRKSGHYAVLIDLDPDARGKRRRKSLGTYRTHKEAERAERDALSARDRGIDIVPSQVTLDGLFRRYMFDAEARRLSGTTLHGYEQIWKRVAPLASIPVTKLKPAHLAELFARLGRDGWTGGKGALSTRSIQHTHTLLSTILAWAVRLEIVGRNVAEAVSPPKGGRKSAQPYQYEDAKRLIAEAAKTRYGPLVIFDFATGLRRGELAGLRWNDVNLERRTATIAGSIAQIPRKSWYKATKTDKVATIALSGEAVAALRAQRAQQAAEKLQAGAAYVDEGFGFAPQGGGIPSPGALGSAVRAIAKKAGLTLRGIHAMRHSTGSWLIRAGVDVRTVAAILRHSSAATTLGVYSHEIEGAQAEAVQHLDKHIRKSQGNRLATET